MFYFLNMVRETAKGASTPSPRIQRKRLERQEKIIETSMQLLADGGSRSYRVPFTASSIFSRLRGDVRSGKIVLLRSDLRADPEEERGIELYVLRPPED